MRICCQLSGVYFIIISYNIWENIHFVDNITNYFKKHLSKKSINKIKNSDLFIFAWKFVNNYFLNQWITHKRYRSEPLSFDGKLGSNLIGFMDVPSGIGAAAHSSELAMKAAGLPVNVVNINLNNSSNLGRDRVTNFNKPINSNNQINLIQANPPEYPILWRHLGKSLLVRKYNIGVWYWELMNLPNDWIKSFQVLDEIWAATRFIQETIQKNSPVPVIKIPPCVNVELDLSLTRNDFLLPENAFLFLCTFDVRSICERKNPLAAVKAFKKAFQANDSAVGLVIKVNNSTFNSEEIIQIKNEIRDYANCYLINDTYSKIKFNSLVNLVDAFVSLHRAEGFGLILAEAMFLGKPVIATNWSGNTDFMTPDNSCPVDYKLIPVKPGLSPYQSGQVWADADISHASHFMNKLCSDHGFYNEISVNARESIIKNFLPEKIGNIMKKRLEEIYGQL